MTSQENIAAIDSLLPAELEEIQQQIVDFTLEELRALVMLEACVRQTLDPLKVVLLIERMLSDLGFLSEIHVQTSPEELETPIPHSFSSPSMIRCPFELDFEVARDDFGGCIDLVPKDPTREVSERERRFLNFFCRQAGSVLAHQWTFQKLSRTQENLRSALSTVQEISAFIGHEIRSPLASLHSLSFLIQDQIREMRKREKPSSEDWKKITDKMNQSSALLQKVVRSTYLLGTLDMDEESFHRELEWLEMGKSLLISAGTVYSYEIKRRNLLVSVRREKRIIHDYVHARRTWFEAVFDNLLGNAVKYSSEGGRIDFSIREKDGEYVIHVSNPVDTPPSPERLNRLFEKGYRGEQRFSQKTIGANQGLGLYFVNRIVTQGYGGKVRVWVEKNRNKDCEEEGEEVETRLFGTESGIRLETGAVFFHIEIRIPKASLQGMF